MNPQHPELFPQRPVRSDFGRVPSYRTRRIITVSVVVVIMAVGGRLIFGGSLFHSGEIATIKAEGAWKQRPEQPGGLDIPNQNVQVYQALDNKDGTKPQPEHLLPPPEVPQISSAPAASQTAAAPPGSSSAPEIESLTPPKLEIDNISPPIETTVEAPVPAPAPTPAPSAPVPAAAPVAAIQAAPPAVPIAAPAPVTAKTVTAPPAAKAKPQTIAQVLKDVDSIPQTQRIVQLASVQDEATAQDMAEKLQTRYASVLGTARLRTVQADVEGKGIFYRIQSQPVSGERANAICDALKKMKAGCILVRP